MKKIHSLTIQDVANRAGVSSATVSRFFSRRNVVSEAAAARIQEAVDALGYMPNLLAGGLASQRTKLVAIVVPALSQSPFERTIETIVDALAIEGYTAMLCLTGTNEQNLNSALNTALGRRAEAIILTGILANPEARQRLRDTGVTIIETWGLPHDPIDCAVGFSHKAVGEATAEYVHRRGYQQPLIITAKGTRASERSEGFVRRWQELTTSHLEEIDVESPSSFSQARAVFRKVRALDFKPDVIVAGSDSMAMGLIVEATHAKIAIPDELAIIGFGNQPIAADMRPSITTVSIDGARIGREAARLLQQRGENEPTGDIVIDVGFEILSRESA
jgi:LacI family gluconate utilization system Gnt-I transcriptional repressor